MAALELRPRALQGAVDRDLAAFEHLRDLRRPEAEHVAKNEDRPLHAWEALEGGDERQRYRLLCLEACFRSGRGLRDPLEQGVGVGLKPQRLPPASGLG